MKGVRLFLLSCMGFFSTMNATEILSLGGVLIDKAMFVSDEFFEKVPGLKGGSSLLSYEQFHCLLKDYDQSFGMTPGGSAVNTLKGLASLGHDCAFIGIASEDQEGRFFVESLKSKGVTLHVQKIAAPSAQCLCLITPDHERTMRTFLGPTHDYGNIVLQPELFEGVALAHAEGYLMHDQVMTKNFFAYAKEAGAVTSLDMGCFEVVEARRDFILELLKTDVDIVFANELEARTLTSLDPEEACEYLSKLCDIAVVTLGCNGGWVKCGNQKVKFAAFCSSNVIDTTGAGDLFISGFLHGYLKEKSLEECARYGAVVAAKVVQVIGAGLSDESWDEINEIIHPRES